MHAPPQSLASNQQIQETFARHDEGQLRHRLGRRVGAGASQVYESLTARRRRTDS